MKLNEVLIVPKSIIVSIQAIAIETQNKELIVLTEMCRVAYNLPEEIVNNAFEAGCVYSHSGTRQNYPNKEEYIKNLEI